MHKRTKNDSYITIKIEPQNDMIENVKTDLFNVYLVKILYKNIHSYETPTRFICI